MATCTSESRVDPGNPGDARPGGADVDAAIVAGGILTMYAAVNDRMRAMTAEGLSRLTDDCGELAAASARPSAAQERLRLIDAQLPRLVPRHRLHNALFLIYTAILFVVVAMVLVAIAVTVPAGGVGIAARVFLLVATVTLMGGLVLVAQSVRESVDAVDYEVDDVLKLGR
jgi:hypothetical protein